MIILKRLFQYPVLLPIFSGLFLVLTLPFLNLSGFLWVSIIPLLIFAGNNERKKSHVFLGGVIVGLIYFFAVAYPLSSLNAWWWFDFGNIVNGNKVVLSLFFVFILALVASIFYGLFAVIYQKFHKDNLVDILIFPLVWIILEYFRAGLLLGFTWGHVGYALHNNVWLLQLAKFFGVYSLSFFVVMVNILVYLFIRSLLKSTTKRPIFSRFLNKYLYLLFFFFVLALSYGFWNIKSGEKELSIKKEMKVVVVQGGLKTKAENTEGFYKKFINEALTQNPDIIVLPENTLWFLMINRKTMLPLKYEISPKIKKAYDDILEISRKNKNVSFIIGFHTTENNMEYNSMIVFEDGKIKSIYDKRILMPFSETGVFNSLSTVSAGTFLEPGARHQFVQVKGINITALICSEIIFPELLKENNTKFIINIGNDSVFDNTIVAEQNHIIAKIQAVKSGKFVVRSMKTGVSSIIDPFGRVAVSLGSGESGSIFSTVRY